MEDRRIFQNCPFSSNNRKNVPLGEKNVKLIRPQRSRWLFCFSDSDHLPSLAKLFINLDKYRLIKENCGVSTTFSNSLGLFQRKSKDRRWRRWKPQVDWLAAKNFGSQVTLCARKFFNMKMVYVHFCQFQMNLRQKRSLKNSAIKRLGCQGYILWIFTNDENDFYNYFKFN